MDLDKLLEPEVLIFVIGALIAIVAIVSSCVKSCVKDRGERELKQTMLEQGRSVEEIERVLRAGTEPPTQEKTGRNTETGETT